MTECKICELKAAGVDNPEDYVLPQYYLSNDPTRIPTPIDTDVSLEGGILLLNPEEIEEGAVIPQSGGMFGTVKGLFKALGFKKEEKEVPISKDVAKKKRTGGLYDDRIR